MPAIDTDVNLVQKMFDVNVFGPMRMIHEFHPLLIKSQGTIVNIGSVGGIVPYMYGGKVHLPSRKRFLAVIVSCAKKNSFATEASYNASKAALHHYGNTLRVELAPLG